MKVQPRGALIVSMLSTLIACGGDDAPPPSGGGGATDLVAVNGTRYNAALGSASIFPALQFATQTSSGSRVAGTTIQFSLISGDGQLSADSLTSDANGLASLTYTFSQSQASALIRAVLPGEDSVDVRLFADALIPVDTSLLTARSTGAAVPGRFPGQGQYLQFSETLGDVTAVNGPPISAPADPNDYFNYAEYDLDFGLVFMIWDVNQDNVVTSDEPIRGVIATAYDTPNPYSGRTLDSIRLGGSTFRDVVNRYGVPDLTSVDPTPPPALVATWLSIGMTVFCNTTPDSLVQQITLVELERPPGLSPAQSKTITTNSLSGRVARYKRTPFL